MSTLGVNSTLYARPELHALAQVVNLDFILNDATPTMRLTYDNLPEQYGVDGITFSRLNIFGTTAGADMHILPQWSTQTYIFLHELGHGLGLVHHGNSLTDTLMVEDAGGKFPGYDIESIKEFTHDDILLLWGAYGVARGYTGTITGNNERNLLYGGCGTVDPRDNGEFIFGMAGSDTIYANGGNDTVYGGSGQADPRDGSDTIYGGTGLDLIYGNGGDDYIDVRDGQADTVYGGLGNDTVIGDPFDIFVDSSSSDSFLFT